MIPSSAILRRAAATQLLSQGRVLLPVQRATARTGLLVRHLSATISVNNIGVKMSLPETVEAIAIERTGDVDVLEKKKVPFPAHGPGNIVIKVRTRLSYSGVTAQYALV